jgi:hypothetical protein
MKAWAVSTAAWPIIASMTNRTSSGSVAARMSAAWAISSASIARRPAVSTMTTSRLLAARLLDAVAGDRPGRRSRGCPRRTRSPRRTRHVAALGCEHRHAGALAHDLQLGHRVGALEVRRHEQRGVALLLEPVAELARERRLTGALQADQHDDRRRVLGELDRTGRPAEDRDELLVDDLDDLLARVERLMHLGAEGPLAHLGGELPYDGQRNVRIQQRHPDVPDGGI